ncbi:uncharacterized protein TNCV_2019371 [Trichonephila clavipes]|nr:uncharacterized protein TNCV_2019371 [Trichonephila clavipes]
MFDSSSYENPTPLAHADTSREVLPRGEGAEYVGRNIEELFVEARQNMRKQNKTWGKYYNRKRREINIKLNDLVLVQVHFMIAAGRRVVGKFMPKFEGPYTVLEVRNNNLIIWKKGKSVTVNVDQVRVYHPRQSDTISTDSYVETLYEGQRRVKWVSGQEGFKVVQICRKRSLQGSEHRDEKRPTPEPTQGIKKTIPSSISARKYKYRRPNKPSQGSQSIAGPHIKKDTRQGKPTTEESRQERSGQYDKARETRTTTSGTNRAAERRPVWSKQVTAVRPCPYYLCSRVKLPEGIPEERRRNGIDSIPQNNSRRRSLNVETLYGDPVDRSE